MATIPPNDEQPPVFLGHVDKWLEFSDDAITDPAVLQSLCLPLPRNFVTIVGQPVTGSDGAVPPTENAPILPPE